MFSITHCIGGIKIIKENGNLIAWIDLFGDFQQIGFLPSSKKEELISFLKEQRIPYKLF